MHRWRVWGSKPPGGTTHVFNTFRSRFVADLKQLCFDLYGFASVNFRRSYMDVCRFAWIRTDWTGSKCSTALKCIIRPGTRVFRVQLVINSWLYVCHEFVNLGSAPMKHKSRYRHKAFSNWRYVLYPQSGRHKAILATAFPFVLFAWHGWQATYIAQMCIFHGWGNLSPIKASFWRCPCEKYWLRRFVHTHLFGARDAYASNI